MVEWPDFDPLEVLFGPKVNENGVFFPESGFFEVKWTISGSKVAKAEKKGL